MLGPPPAIRVLDLQRRPLVGGNVVHFHRGQHIFLLVLAPEHENPVGSVVHHRTSPLPGLVHLADFISFVAFSVERVASGDRIFRVVSPAQYINDPIVVANLKVVFCHWNGLHLLYLASRVRVVVVDHVHVFLYHCRLALTPHYVNGLALHLDALLAVKINIFQEVQVEFFYNTSLLNNIESSELFPVWHEPVHECGPGLAFPQLKVDCLFHNSLHLLN